MRMWMIHPDLMCIRHLRGELYEFHKHRHLFVKRHSIKGRVEGLVVQIEPLSMKKRHDYLVREWVRRGYNHNSPYEMPDLSYLPKHHREAKVDMENSIRELYRKCPECRKRMIEHGINM
jgi:hypothetical protein